MAAQQPARTSPELRARLHSARANVGITPRPGALPGASTHDRGKLLNNVARLRASESRSVSFALREGSSPDGRDPA